VGKKENCKQKLHGPSKQKKAKRAGAFEEKKKGGGDKVVGELAGGATKGMRGRDLTEEKVKRGGIGGDGRNLHGKEKKCRVKSSQKIQTGEKTEEKRGGGNRPGRKRTKPGKGLREDGLKKKRVKDPTMTENQGTDVHTCGIEKLEHKKT